MQYHDFGARNSRKSRTPPEPRYAMCLGKLRGGHLSYHCEGSSTGTKYVISCVFEFDRFLTRRTCACIVAHRQAVPAHHGTAQQTSSALKRARNVLIGPDIVLLAFPEHVHRCFLDDWIAIARSVFLFFQTAKNFRRRICERPKQTNWRNG